MRKKKWKFCIDCLHCDIEKYTCTKQGQKCDKGDLFVDKNQFKYMLTGEIKNVSKVSEVSA